MAIKTSPLGDSAHIGASATIRPTYTGGGSGRTLFAGGSTGSDSNVIDYCHPLTKTNALDFGDLSVARRFLGAVGSRTRAVFGGGSGGADDEIDYITFSSLGNATDFGDLTLARGCVGASNQTRGLFMGGSSSDVIDYITIASTGNASDFGDLNVSRYLSGAVASASRAVCGGGTTYSNTIEYATIASTGNASDFGDLSVGRQSLAGGGNHTRGLFAGGHTGSLSNVIDYITIADHGKDASDWGDLNDAIEGIAGTGIAGAGIAMFAGGHNGSAYVANTFTASLYTKGNSSDSGLDLSTARSGMAVISDDHGGLFSPHTSALNADRVNYDIKSSFAIPSALQKFYRDIGRLDNSKYYVAQTNVMRLDEGEIKVYLGEDTFDYTLLGTITSPGEYSFTFSGNVYPSTLGRALLAGGIDSNNTSNSEYFTIASTGTMSHFGELSVKRRNQMNGGNSTRAIWASGNNPDGGLTWYDTIDYQTYASLGTAIDFGTVSIPRAAGGTGIYNEIRSIFYSGNDSGGTEQNIVEYVNNSTDGNAITFSECGDGVGRYWVIGASNPTMALVIGGTIVGTSNNNMYSLYFSTLGEVKYWDDLGFNSAEAVSGCSRTRAVIMGGVRPSGIGDNANIWSLEFSTKGAATDWGDLTILRDNRAGGVASSTRAVCIGGAVSAVKDYVEIATLGNAISFGGLFNNRRYCAASSDCGGNMLVPTSAGTEGTGAGATDRGIYMTGDNGGAYIDYITISTTGNATNFGDSVNNIYGPRGGASSTRGVLGSGTLNASTVTNVIEYCTIATTSSFADFGDLTVARDQCVAFSNEVRATWVGGEDSGNQEQTVADSVIIATTGNAVDFGSIVARTAGSGLSTKTHGYYLAGANASGAEVSGIFYHTIDHGGELLDWGDLSSQSIYQASAGNYVRGVISGGYHDPPQLSSDTITYISYSTRGTSVDYGTLDEARSTITSVANRTRVVTGGGGALGSRNYLQYTTITTGGVATYFGDLIEVNEIDYAGISDVHGGLDLSQPRAIIEISSPNLKTVVIDSFSLKLVDAIESTSEIGVPTIAESHAFTANNDGLESASEVEEFNLSEIHILKIWEDEQLNDPGMVDGREFTSAIERALVMGGSTDGGRQNTVDYVNMRSTGNATDFGDLSAVRDGSSATSSITRALIFGGFEGSSRINTIEYFTIYTTGNATDFGDMSQQVQQPAATSNDIFALRAGGDLTGVAGTNVIEYVVMVSTGNATDFGDLTVARWSVAGCSSPTRSVFGGGFDGSLYDTIDYVTIATTGNATDFGDLLAGVESHGGSSTNTRGLFGGGQISGTVYYDVIQRITIGTTGNSVDWGDLAAGTQQIAAAGNDVDDRVFFFGGYTPTYLNTVQYVDAVSSGNATDFGDLTVGRRKLAAASDTHGGLDTDTASWRRLIDTDFTGGAWEIGGGTMTIDGSVTSGHVWSRITTLTSKDMFPGETYRVQINVATYTSGNVAVYLGSGTGTNDRVGNVTSAGLFNEIMDEVDTETVVNLYLRSYATTDMVIDAISVTRTDTLTSVTSLEQPTFSQEHALTADNGGLNANTQLETPELTTAVDLFADDMQSNTQLETPAITQNHQFTANNGGLNVVTQVDNNNVDIGQNHNVTANNDGIESVPEIEEYNIFQNHQITAQNGGLNANTQLETPNITQEHALTVTEITANTELEDPVFSETNIFTVQNGGIESNTQLEVPAFTQIHTFNTQNGGLNANTQLETPNIGQEHALTANSIESASEVEETNLTEKVALPAVSEITANTEVENPAITQNHLFTANNGGLESVTPIDDPVIAEIHNLHIGDNEALNSDFASDLSNWAPVNTTWVSGRAQITSTSGELAGITQDSFPLVPTYVYITMDYEIISAASAPVVQIDDLTSGGSYVGNLTSINLPTTGGSKGTIAYTAITSGGVRYAAKRGGGAADFYVDNFQVRYVQGLGVQPENDTSTLGHIYAFQADNGGIESASQLEEFNISQLHDLNVTEVSANTEVDTPTIGQDHNLTVTEITANTEVDNPILTEEFALFANDIESATICNDASLGHKYIFTATEISANTEVGNPTVAQVQDLLADSIESASQVEEFNISQVHNMTVSEIEAQPEVDNPVIGQTHDLVQNSIEATTSVPEGDPPLLGQEHVLTVTEITANTEVDNPVFQQAHGLGTPPDITSNTEVDTGTFGQNHNMGVDDGELASTSEVENPAIGQEHALTASDIESASEVEEYNIIQIHNFVVTEVSANTEVDTPAIGQDHNLTATDTESDSELEPPVLTQKHVLVEQDIQAFTVVDNPVLAEDKDPLTADDMTSLSEVDNPVLGHNYVFTATEFESDTEVETPVVGQVHNLTADDLQSQSEVESTNISQTHNITAADIVAASEIELPAFGQVHNMTATDIEAVPELDNASDFEMKWNLTVSEIEALTAVDAGTIGQVHNLSTTGIESPTDVEEWSIAQEHYLLTGGIESPSETANPSMYQTHDMTAVDIESGSEVETPVGLEKDVLNAIGVSSTPENGTPLLVFFYLLFAQGIESIWELDQPGKEIYTERNRPPRRKVRVPINKKKKHVIRILRRVLPR